MHPCVNPEIHAPERVRPFVAMMNEIQRKGRPMKLSIAAALIGAAVAFAAPVVAPVSAPAGSLPDGTPVIEVGGRHFGGNRSGNRGGGRKFRHRGGGRDFGRRGGGRDFGRHGGGRRFGRHGGRHGGHRGHGHGHGHDYYGPFVYGGIALGTFLFLDALDHD
jgi:hypothetical protein